MVRTQPGRRALRRTLAVVVACTAMLAAGSGLRPAVAASSTVTAVQGSGFGYWSDEISLFGGAQTDTGPTPTVSLASDATNSPQSATATTGLVAYGPATLFSSDAITVEAAGSLGTTGSVTTTSDIQNVNYADTQAATGSEIFGYPPPETDPQYINFNPQNLRTSVAGTASADASGVSGSATITNGMVRTHAQSSTDCVEPIEVNPCGREGEAHTHEPMPSVLNPDSNPEGVVTIPANPPPNYTVAGHLHLGSTTTDYFVLVFNEQVVNPDGSITVRPVHEYFGYKLDAEGNIVQDLPNAEGGSVLHGHLYLGQVTAGVTAAQAGRAPMADFDGDGDTDISVFRPSSGAWYVQGQSTTYHGRDGDAAVPADYDGDSDSDVAVFRPANGGWYVQGQPTVYHGRTGDLPVPADYDGDGDADIAVFRPSSGGWYVAGQAPVFFGGDGDIPVPGYYDADPEVDLAVFRPSVGAWYVQGQPTAYFGRTGDIPAPADYDGDGDDDIAVFRPSVGAWYVQGQPTVYLGRNGDVPVPADYAGDGTADIAVFRPSVGAWYVQGSPTVYFGRSGDAPLPLPHAIYQAFF